MGITSPSSSPNTEKLTEWYLDAIDKEIRDMKSYVQEVKPEQIVDVNTRISKSIKLIRDAIDELLLTLDRVNDVQNNNNQPDNA